MEDPQLEIHYTRIEHSVVISESSSEVVVSFSPITESLGLGLTGPQGPQGVAGIGIPIGGNTNDIFVKASNTDYDTTWTDNPTLDAIQFDLSALEAPSVGKINWFTDDGTLQVGLSGGNINLSIGQEQVVRIKNTTGFTLNKGQVVAIIGAQGQRLKVALASSNAESTSSKTFGIVAETILNENEGFVATNGLLRGLNTNLYTEGSAIWLGQTPGTYTTNKPQAPLHMVHLGWIARQGSGNSGSIFVHVQNGFELDELHDVKIVNASTGNLLQRKSSGLWENVSESDVTWRELNPEFTYSAGILTRIDYDSGNYKLFTYSSNKVTRIDYIRGERTIRKDFSYNLDGSLASITQTEI